jgi:hypothetical protein
LISPAVSRKQSAAPRAALTLVESRLPEDPFLLAHFERFYREVLESKSELSDHTPGAVPSRRAAEIHERLLALLLQQEDEVSRSGTLLGVEMYRQSQRVMACMADEIFSAAHWPANAPWQSLETELFEADRQYGLALDGPCMKKLDLLLQQDDPAYRELATVYFYALALARKNEDARQRYWPGLLKMIGGDSGQATENGRVFAQSYAHTLAENKVTMLPSAHRWWLALALIACTWLSLSWLVWNYLSAPVQEKLDNIHQTLQP